VSPKYSPAGSSLASVTVVGVDASVDSQEIETNIYKQLEEWYGPEEIKKWKFLKMYRYLLSFGIINYFLTCWVVIFIIFFLTQLPPHPIGSPMPNLGNTFRTRSKENQ